MESFSFLTPIWGNFVPEQTRACATDVCIFEDCTTMANSVFQTECWKGTIGQADLIPNILSNSNLIYPVEEERAQSKSVIPTPTFQCFFCRFIVMNKNYVHPTTEILQGPVQNLSIRKHAWFLYISKSLSSFVDRENQYKRRVMITADNSNTRWIDASYFRCRIFVGQMLLPFQIKLCLGDLVNRESLMRFWSVESFVPNNTAPGPLRSNSGT